MDSIKFKFIAIWILVVVTQQHVTSANPIETELDFDEGSADSDESDAPKHFITVEEIPVEHIENGTEKLLSIEELLGIGIASAVEGHTDTHWELENSTRTRRKIIGVDDRLPVPTNYVNRFPYCAIGRLDVGCSAFMIGPHHALTAGHCVYDIHRDVWTTANLTMWRGRTCNARGARMVMSRVWSFLGYTRDHRDDYDLALIAFNNRTSRSPCWLSFGPVPQRWPGVGFRLYGYPQDYARRSGCSYNTMSLSSCSFSRTSHGGLAAKYKCDVIGGISGAGLYGDIGSTYGPVVYGVNAYEYRSSSYPWNGGPLLTESRFCTIIRLMNSTGYHPTCGGKLCCT